MFPRSDELEHVQGGVAVEFLSSFVFLPSFISCCFAYIAFELMI